MNGVSNLTESHLPCPNCSSSDAYSTYDDGHGWCFSCQYYKPSNDVLDNFTYEYLERRGISKETHRFYKAASKINEDGLPVAIGYPYPNGATKVRTLGKKGFYSVGDIGKAGLYGRNLFPAGSARYITITEGEDDALSLYEVLKAPVVSVQSASTAGRDCGIDRAYLNSFERIYLAFDNDEPGREAVRNVAKLFDYNKVYVVKIADPYKDANDYLQAGQSEALKKIWWNSKKYLPETIISSFSDFEVILKEPQKLGVPYPFHTLQYMTDGMRTSESVLITAMEGVGKTEVMHSLLHQNLKETEDAVCAIFLEEPKKRLLQALAGIELRRPVHLPEYDPGFDATYGALKSVVGTDDRLHVYSHFGSDDPEVLLDTIRFAVSARACRRVFLDHITMAVSGMGGDDERRALDYLSTRLEMMVKELDFSLIFVSHVNDLGQTRGSRNISKIADIRIDLSRDLLSSDETERRTTKVRVSKNRYSGRTGDAGTLYFDPRTYVLSETIVGANDNEQLAVAI